MPGTVTRWRRPATAWSPTRTDAGDAQCGDVEREPLLVGERHPGVVGHHHVDLGALAAQLGGETGGRLGEPPDAGDRGQLRRRVDHPHGGHLDASHPAP